MSVVAALAVVTVALAARPAVARCALPAPATGAAVGARAVAVAVATVVPRAVGVASRARQGPLGAEGVVVATHGRTSNNSIASRSKR